MVPRKERMKNFISLLVNHKSAGDCVLGSEVHGKGRVGSRGINLGVTGVFFKTTQLGRRCK